MKLCGGFSLLLKRLEIGLNQFFDDIFLKVDLIGFFRELYIRKFREFVSGYFYDKEIDFTIKNRFFIVKVRRPGNHK